MSWDSEHLSPLAGPQSQSAQSQSAQEQVRDQYAAQPAVQSFPRPQSFPAPQGMPVMIAPKNPAISLIVSFFIPGLGSIINGRVGIGVTILVIYIVGAILSVVLIGIPIAIGAWVWGMVDGYKSAQSWNHARGILS